MNLPLFIAQRLSYRGRVVTAAVAVSFLVVIIAVAVSAGFRREIHNGISAMTAFAPQHFLYFLPLPQGQGSLTPINPICRL